MLRALVSSLITADIPEYALESVMNRLYNLCHNSHALFQTNQNFACQLGVVDGLLRIGHSTMGERVRMLAFRLIGQVIFFLKKYLKFFVLLLRLQAIIFLLLLLLADVFQQSRSVTCCWKALTNCLNNFVSAFWLNSCTAECCSRCKLNCSRRDVLANPEDSAGLKEEAIYSVKNAAANSWESHSHFAHLIPVIVVLLKAYMHDNHSLSAQCVFFIGVLAYNPASRLSLLEGGVISALVDVMRLKDNQIFPTSAALALGCLMGHTDTDPSLDVVDDDLMWQLMQAMEVTLQGKSFPLGSELYYTSW
jgi:hypothetical protein